MRLSRLELGLQLELENSPYSIFIKRNKFIKEKNLKPNSITAVPVLQATGHHRGVQKAAQDQAANPLVQ
jgi:hypothetical protein